MRALCRASLIHTGSNRNGFGSRSHRRRGQLRRIAGAGSRVLQGRRPGVQGAGPDARPVRRVPRPRRRVRRRVRRGRQEGRSRPRGRHRSLREQHHQDLRRAQHRRDGPARPHPRRPRPVLPGDDRGVCRGAGRRRPDPQGQADRRPRLLSARRLRGRGEVLRPVRHRRQGRLRQRPSGLHRRRPRSGRTSSPRRASRSSATTSSPRSAPPSRTASWRSCSRTGASSWTAPCS